MTWIRGRNILDPPYNKTPVDIFIAVRTRQLVAYRDYHSFYPDPNEPRGMQRYFYFISYHQGDKLCEPRGTRDRLGGLRYQRDWMEDWLSKTDEEILKDDAESLEWHRRTGASLPVFESIIERRRQYQEKLSKMAPEIERLEMEFEAIDPLPSYLSAKQQEEITAELLECAYRIEEVENWVRPPRKEDKKSSLSHTYARARELKPKIENLYNLMVRENRPIPHTTVERLRQTAIDVIEDDPPASS
jgi:hypothetical protein